MVEREIALSSFFLVLSAFHFFLRLGDGESCYFIPSLSIVSVMRKIRDYVIRLPDF